MSIPAFSGCTNGSYCSNQAATKVGSNQTQIYHRTVTTLSGQGPAYTGSETKTYIKNSYHYKCLILYKKLR
jgi:hypothetical protein